MSAHGSGHGARSPPSRGLISGTATSVRYKLNAKLDMLDPTATLAINDWLINLRAAAGSEFKLCFMTRPQLVEKFRVDKGKPYTTYPDFDSIAGGFSAWCRENSMGQLSEVLYGWIINNVDWKKDPELARKIRGADGDDGFSVDSNGAGLYAYLRERGSAMQPHVQSEMETEWASVYAEAHSKSQTKTVFTDVSTSDAVLTQMSTLLETYEKIAAHQKSPPNVFIGTMLRLLSREIPCLQDWAKAELNTLILKPADYDSRSRWVSDTVAVLLRQHLPSSKPLYQAPCACEP